MDATAWNWISVQFDRRVRSKIDKTGKQLIPLFLDTILQDSCSPEVKDAFAEALKDFFKPDKRDCPFPINGVTTPEKEVNNELP